MLGLQGQADGFPIRAEGGRIDSNDRQPTGVSPPEGFGHEVDAGQITDSLSILFTFVNLISEQVMSEQEILNLGQKVVVAWLPYLRSRFPTP